MTYKNQELQNLVQLAQEIKLPPNSFDCELEDACNDDAELAYEDITSQDLYRQLEFLYLHGFDLKRLEKLIRELSKETN